MPIILGENSTRGLGSLNLARYILKEIKENENCLNISHISKQYDNNKKFVLSIIEFLKEMEWLSEDENGKYITTQEGSRNNLDNLIFWKLNMKIKIKLYIKIKWILNTELKRGFHFFLQFIFQGSDLFVFDTFHLVHVKPVIPPGRAIPLKCSW